jgi:hypothetical protein
MRSGIVRNKTRLAAEAGGPEPEMAAFLAAIRDSDLIGQFLQDQTKQRSGKWSDEKPIPAAHYEIYGDQSRVAHFLTIMGTRHVAYLAVTDVSRGEFEKIKAKMTPQAYLLEEPLRAVLVEVLGPYRLS